MKELQTRPLADGFVFLEGPRWHQGELWLSDMWGHTVFRVTEDGTRSKVVEVPGRPSGIGFLPDGTPLVVSMADRSLYRIVDGGLKLHADLGHHVDSDINDMVVDGAGRAYVGNFGYDLLGGEEARTAVITLVEPDGSSRVAADGLEFPNGAVLLADGRLVVAETFGHRLSVFDRSADGALSNKSVYAELGERTPDGICLDVDGGIWISSFQTGEFVRLDTAANVTHRIDVAGRCAVACQLGGADGRTLFCLTYAGTMEDLAVAKPAAAIEVVQVDSAAAGSP